MVKLGVTTVLFLWAACAQHVAALKCYHCGYSSVGDWESSTACKTGDILNVSLVRECTLELGFPTIPGPGGRLVEIPKVSLASTYQDSNKTDQNNDNEEPMFGCIEYRVDDERPETDTTYLLRTCMPYTSSDLVQVCKDGTLAEWGRASDIFSQFVYLQFSTFFPGDSKVSGCSCMENECNRRLNEEGLVGGTGGMGGGSGSRNFDASFMSMSLFLLFSRVYWWDFQKNLLNETC